jgi:hypothetical protein
LAIQAAVAAEHRGGADRGWCRNTDCILANGGVIVPSLAVGIRAAAEESMSRSGGRWGRRIDANIVFADKVGAAICTIGVRLAPKKDWTGRRRGRWSDTNAELTSPTIATASTVSTGLAAKPMSIVGEWCCRSESTKRHKNDRSERRIIHCA